MNKNIALNMITSILLIIFNGTVAYAGSLESKLLIADEATDLIVSEPFENKRTQIQYSIEIKYPDFAIGDKELNLLKKHSWKGCNKIYENELWFIYKESNKFGRRFVYRHSDHLVKGNTLLTISMSYYSDEQNTKNHSHPNNNDQKVVILFDEYETSETLEAVIEELELSCKGT